MKKLKIQIVSDVVCPWCYIGKSRLEKALQENPEVQAEISWAPFQLHPEIPEGNQENYLEFLGNKYNRDPQPMIDQMENVAFQEGVKMQFSNIKNVPNTLQAHRLMHLARKEGKDDTLSIILFKAYFEEGKDVENQATLVDYGKAAGLSDAAITAFQNDESLIEEVKKEETQYRQAGISAVPTFIVNDQYMIQGAQPADVWQNAFSQIEGLSTDAEGQCGPDGCSTEP
ncbi:DsbA family oxidoreductase [Persicobacter psychrovividus]|uniref:DSBA oxidoreductase n=1 Tax=Persicobacter psychrovividus TaxID=387638 RepID=A0ABN6LCM8_9BACT|nr:DSBA oxidoreductase [Persicobacter psychrovividus]